MVIFPVNHEEFQSNHKERGDGWALFVLFQQNLLIAQQLQNIMSSISDFSAKMTAFFDRQDTAVADLQGDVDNLTKQIAALQTSGGAITAEDQALLDGIQARASTVSDKLDALDALTPPVAPAA